jgi:hypothetical protein
MEHRELSRRELDLAAGPCHDVRRRIDPQVPDLEDGGTLGRPAADQRSQAREQLAEVERLDEVVVSARVETANAVAHLVASGQHQHGHPALPAPQ